MFFHAGEFLVEKADEGAKKRGSLMKQSFIGDRRVWNKEHCINLNRKKTLSCDTKGGE